MTTHNSDSATDIVRSVTFDDVRAIMAGFDVELAMGTDPSIGGANLNGVQVTFAMIGEGVFIVRADVPTDTATDSGDPTLFLAANNFNAYSFDVKAAVVNRTETLILRTESETLVAAGMSYDQLKAAVKRSVDAVLTAQQALEKLIADISAKLGPAS